MTLSDSEEPVYVSAFVERPLRLALEDAALRHDRSLSGEIRMALLAYLAEPDQLERSPFADNLPMWAVYRAAQLDVTRP